MNIDSITRTFNTANIPTLIINVLSAIGVAISVIAGLSAAGADINSLSSHSDTSIPNETKTVTETKTKTKTPQPITAQQGMRILTPFGQRTEPDGTTINIRKTCTLSYIDHVRRIGYTSAHCLGPVDNGTYTGGSVTVSNKDRQPIGQAWPNKIYVAGESHNPYDIAIIRFDDDVILEENIYSGDNLITSSDIVDSDTFCTYGATSLKVRCGDDTSSYGLYPIPGQFHVVGAGTKPGDSGSPVWIRDENGNTKGYLGVLSGHLRDSGPNAIGTTIESLDPAEFDAQAFAGL